MAMKRFPEENTCNEKTADARCVAVSCAGSSLEHERIPALILKGSWLEKAGFPIGTLVDVRVCYGCLVLTARKADKEASEKMAALAELDALEPRERVLRVG